MGKIFDGPLVLLPILVVVLLVWLIVKLTRRTEAPSRQSEQASGWYVQPDGTQRWWDGAGWTEDQPPPPG